MPLLHRSYSNSRYRGGRVTSHPTAYPLTGSRYITGMPYDVFGAMKAKCLPIGMEFERFSPVALGIFLGSHCCVRPESYAISELQVSRSFTQK